LAEQLIINPSADKKTRYEELLPQIEALVTGESDLVANLANVAAAIKYGMNFFWVGFYLVNSKELILGPFQGPVACTRIEEGKGVCGTVMKTGEALIVPDVNLFPGHISCNASSKSEIVVPLKIDDKVVGVLDIDSEFLNNFDSVDLHYLQRLSIILEQTWMNQKNK
jgi:L-methionine (R)-S-oxide reductase